LTRFPIEGKAARRLLFRITKIDGRFSAALRRLSGKLMVEGLDQLRMDRDPRPVPAPLEFSSVEVNYIKRLRELIRHFQPPIQSRLQSPAHVLNKLAGGDCSFVPSSVAIQKFFSFEIRLLAVVINIEKVFWHEQSSMRTWP
jgi:hypothetical protein